MEEDPHTYTDTASLQGTATASLLSSSLFSGSVVKLTAEEEGTFRGRPSSLRCRKCMQLREKNSFSHLAKSVALPPQ
jgi:hypothetical protein